MSDIISSEAGRVLETGKGVGKLYGVTIKMTPEEWELIEAGINNTFSRDTSPAEAIKSMLLSWAEWRKGRVVLNTEKE